MIMKKLLNHFIEELEIEYSQHPRLILFASIVLMYFAVLIQSYFALPRDFTTVFLDTWEQLIFFIPLSIIVLRLKVRNLLIFGLIYIILGFAIVFRSLEFIKVQYATISFLAGIWLTGEWINYKKFNKSLLSELLKGNYYLLIGIVLSTVILGFVIEVLNAPAGLWWYSWPFPSLEFLGVPIILVSFGWFPWILAMFVFLYPFALKKPKKFK